MLNNFIFSVNAVFPIFIIILLGFILGRTHFLPQIFFDVSERFVFKIALPVLLFLEVAQAELTEMFDPKLLVYCCLGIIGSFVILCLIVPLFVKSNDKRGAFIQGVYRSNFAILGVPLASNMFGESGASATALVTPFTIIFFNIFAVTVLSMFAPTDKKKKVGVLIRDIVFNILKNPLIIAVVLATPFMFWNIPLPVFATKSMDYIADLSFPLALLNLGGTFSIDKLKGRIGLAAFAAFCKTVVSPFILVTIAALFGFRDASLGIIFILFGAPTAVSSYIMAKNMGSDYDLAGQILFLSSFFCIFTIFVGTFILRTLQLI